MISFISIVFSTIAFIFSVKNEYKKKTNLKVTLLDKHKSFELVVDRENEYTPDVYFSDKYRFLPIISISNESSLPISIIDFSLNNDATFTNFTKVGKLYRVTHNTMWTIGKMGVQHLSNSEEYIEYDLTNTPILKPPFTLQPYEATVGIIVFSYKNSLLGNNKLYINTSRKKQVINISISKKFVSKIP